MPQQTLPPELKKYKQRLENVVGHPFDPVFKRDANAWEMRYVNRSGVHIFTVVFRHDGKRWKISTVTQVLCMGDIIEIG